MIDASLQMLLADRDRLAQLPVYQDMVWAGETVAAGRRDCRSRWEILAPYVPRHGSVLDVGSNLGWFGLKICDSFPDCVVASLEPDERSASWQREVLASHRSDRICLLTSRAGARLADRFLRAGQRFDAVLCLSVLHWIPEHREFLRALDAMTGRFLVEHPDPREGGAGFETVRREIGRIGPYLESLFPERPVTCLARLPSHRECEFLREIWLVDEPPGMPQPPSPGLAVPALLKAAPSWPPRSWWQAQYAAFAGSGSSRGRLLFTPQGLRPSSQPAGRIDDLWMWSCLARLPERRLLGFHQWLYRRARRWAGRILHWMRSFLPESDERSC